MVMLTAWGSRVSYFTGALTRLFMLSSHPVATYIIHSHMVSLCTAAIQVDANANLQTPTTVAC